MAALSQNTDRRAEFNQNSIRRNLPLLASQVPYQGSLLSYDTSTGFVRTLTAGQPFAGIAMHQILSRDTPTVNGGAPNVEAITGLFTFVAVISGVTQADITARRSVYASNDNDLSLTAAAGNTLIGYLVDKYTQIGGVTNGVIIQAITHDFQQRDLGLAGIETLADAPATLTVAQLGKTLLIPNTAARTLTLPAAASCTGRTFTVMKTTAAAFAFTLQGNAAENINGANTAASTTSQWAKLEIISDGAAWYITNKI
jgi:hypothetical protein